MSCTLTSASLHHSRVAIPPATMNSECVFGLYRLTDSAYDAQEIRNHGISLGHMPILDTDPRRSLERKQEKIREAEARCAIGYSFLETQLHAERPTAERVNARLKDEFGATSRPHAISRSEFWH